LEKDKRQKTKDKRRRAGGRERVSGRSERSADSASAEGGEGVIDLNPLLGGVGVGFLRPKIEDRRPKTEVKQFRVAES